MLCVPSTIRILAYVSILADAFLIGQPILCKQSPQKSTFRSYSARLLDILQTFAIMPLDRTLAFCIRQQRKREKGFSIRTRLLICMCIVLMPLTVVCALCGIILRSILQPFRSNIIFKERAGENPLPDATNKLKICSLNVAMSEFETLNAAFQVAKPSDRVNDILFTVLRQDPDVICLQEVFDHRSVAKLCHSLNKKGYHVVAQVDTAFLFGFSSGLLIATKFPFASVHFRRFQSAQGLEILADKGFLLLEYHSQGALSNFRENLQIVCTHLQSGSSSFDLCTTRFAQLEQMRSFISPKSSCEKPVILIGDFNMFYDANVSKRSKNDNEFQKYADYVLNPCDIRCMKPFDHARNMCPLAAKFGWHHVALVHGQDAEINLPMYARGSTSDMSLDFVQESRLAIGNYLPGYNNPKHIGWRGRFLRVFDHSLSEFERGMALLLATEEKVFEEADSHFEQYIPRNYARCLDHIFHTGCGDGISWRAESFVPWGPRNGICTDHHLIVGCITAA